MKTTKKTGVALLALLVLTLALAIVPLAATDPDTRQIPTSGGNRNTTWVEIPLDETYAVLGLTAQETLGRPTGTLSDFAAAMSDYMGTDTIIFPANFFHSYGGPQDNQIIGGIFSEGRVVHNGYMDRGAGFTVDNRFALFHGRFRRELLTLVYQDSTPTEYVTAFNTYPHLIADNARLPIEPMPGVTRAWLDGRVLRAFMGQKADGTFIVGNITGANMQEVQDVARYLGLINATNIDGGASAGIWRNGRYITTPGRQLASVVFITNTRVPERTPAPTPTPTPTPEPIFVEIDGQPVEFQDQLPVIIGGRTLVPVRDVFEALGFTPTWDGPAGRATLTRDDAVIIIVIGESTFTTNAVIHQLDVPAQLISGRTMLPLRHVLESVGYGIDWDRYTRTVIITTG